MDVYLRAKFQVSSIILTSFRQGGHFTQKKEPLKSPPRLGLSKEVKNCNQYYSFFFMEEISLFKVKRKDCKKGGFSVFTSKLFFEKNLV